jgi:hypothetical protein
MGEELSTARPLLYNESVRLFVRPHQQDFIVQESDTFYVKQFDVVRILSLLQREFDECVPA